MSPEAGSDYGWFESLTSKGKQTAFRRRFPKGLDLNLQFIDISNPRKIPES